MYIGIMMRHRHTGGRGRHSEHADAPAEGRAHRHGHGHGRHRGGRGHGRPFDYGELRLLILAMIAEQPRHGYELIKAIEERLGGSYTPSPGVIYPTLSWLDDMGYAEVEVADAGRKLYRITTAGKAFLVANRAAADELLARKATADAGRPGAVPAPIVRAMENLKLAMRLRFRTGPIDQTAAEAMAKALDAAAQVVERS